jgi:hypothetical protein
MRVLRSILAVVAGCFAAGVLTALVEGLGDVIFPPPPGVDLSDHAAMAKIMDQLPLGALLSVLAGWAIGTGGGAAVAARLAPRAAAIHGLIVGLVMMALGVATMLMIPHPVWFWIAAVLLTPASAWIGTKIGAKPKNLAAKTK